MKKSVRRSHNGMSCFFIFSSSLLSSSPSPPVSFVSAISSLSPPPCVLSSQAVRGELAFVLSLSKWKNLVADLCCRGRGKSILYNVFKFSCDERCSCYTKWFDIYIHVYLKLQRNPKKAKTIYGIEPGDFEGNAAVLPPSHAHTYEI